MLVLWSERAGLKARAPTRRAIRDRDADMDRLFTLAAFA